MKTSRYLAVLLASLFLGGAAFHALAQAERVKGKAKDLKKQVEGTNSVRTNAPAPKPAPR